MSILIGLDIGTTGARAVAVSEDGEVVAEASANYALHTPRPGWTEQNPEDWWTATRKVLADVAARIDNKQIAGLGLTGQMHGSVFLNSADEVLRPALLWNDQRTEKQCHKITEAVGAERLIEIAGNPALTGFQAPKILWLRDEEPQNYRKVSRVLLPKDYVRLLLTGEHATDASDASGTLLLDVGKRDWASEILKALEVPLEWMPSVYEGPQKTGELRQSVADELGLPPDIPVAAGAGDNAAAAVGTGIIEPGLLNSSVGTSGVLFAHAETFTPDPSGRIHAFCHAVPGEYHLMGVTLSAGGSFSWWRDALNNALGNHFGGDSVGYERLTQQAASISPGSEGLLFLPYLSGERTPHLDPKARGAFIGLTTRHGVPHMSRAIMEGVIFSLRDSMELMRDLGISIGEVRATGGGAKNPLWRDLQANIYDTPIHYTIVDEGPAYGAALLSGVAAGMYKNVKEASHRIILHEDITEPDPRLAKIYAEYYDLYRSLYPTTAGVMSRLSQLAAV